MPATTVALTGLGAATLAESVRAGELSCVEVIDAHLDRLEEVEPALNAVAVRRSEAARREARAADERQRRGEPLGPLHGVPITVKDQFDVAGLPTSFGTARLAGHTIGRDGAMVAALRTAGAVILAKTNVPQGLGVYETDNEIVGRTNNPWDVRRTPGGSSGGDAALVAAGAAPLALGADFGGSLRVPAAWCGLTTIKPTARRLPLDRAPVRTASGWEGLVAQPGPLSRSVSDAGLALRVLVDGAAANGSVSVPPVPWGAPEDVEVSDLRVAILPEVAGYPVGPAVRRALDLAAAALRARGATVERWAEPPDTTRGAELVLRILSADGFAFARQVVADDPRHPMVAADLRLLSMPAPALRLIRFALTTTRQRAAAHLLGWLGRASAAGLLDLLGDRLAFERSFLEAMHAGGYDLVLCPAHPLPAPFHGQTTSLQDAFGAVTLWNLLGFPAGVTAVTSVRPDEGTERPRSLDGWRRAACRTEAEAAGLPVGVQVAARPWREDQVLAVLGAIEADVVDRAGYPTTPIDPVVP